MQLRQAENVRGFVVTGVQEVPGLNARLYEMEHEKSGARLVWLDREEENKTFAVTFRTVPEDDTGVFHILEHSVLCGSRRYPVKEPFVELMKSSLQTFLNALTFPDKTSYPVCSRNDKDFLNLIRVYMDAVLHPLIYSRPEIFQQEGWRYELDSHGRLSRQGVVLNEMKGAYSDPETLMYGQLNRLLFPDTCYRYESGGHPDHIPELTYESFLERHRRFYHPSNSYLFLDGRVDLEQVLTVLDGEYLAAYDRQEQHTQIPLQAPVRPDPARIPFPAAPGQPAQDRARLAWGFVLGDYSCRRELLGMRVLSDVLCGGSDAPLKRFVLSQGLARDVRLQVMDGIAQPFAVLQLIGLDEGRAEHIAGAVRGELARLAREGLDRDQIAATLANLEFQLRERDYGYMPQGLGLGMTVLESWLYGGGPADGLDLLPLCRELETGVDNGWFEDLLARALLDNGHCCQVLMVPDPCLAQARQERESAGLAQVQASWSQEDWKALEECQARRLAWQGQPDDPEALAALPRLKLTDLSPQPMHIPTRREELDGVPLLIHGVQTGAVDYVNWYFDAGDLDGEELSCLGLLCVLLGELDTGRTPAREIQKRTRLNLGAISFAPEVYAGEGQREDCRVLLCASFSALEEKLPAGAELAAELLLDTRFDDGARIREVLRQTITRLEQEVAASGSSYALTRASAGQSAAGAAREYTGGIAYLQWLKGLEENFDSRRAGLQAQLEGLCRRLVCAGRLTVSLTGQDAAAPGVLAGALLARLPRGERAADAGVRPWGARREGIVIPADVSYAAVSGTLPGQFTGVVQVLGRVVTLDELWGAIRVQGGAYGTGMSVSEAGSAGCYSFRDPNAARSLDCYRQIPGYLRQLPQRLDDLTDFILGTVAAAEPYLTARRQGKTADGWYWKDQSEEQRKAWREQLMAARPEDLAALAGAVEDMLAGAGVCVLGPQGQLEACGDRLERVFPL